MPARTGNEYIQGLREQAPEVYLHGERVEDVTVHPNLANGVRTMARLYDMQHDPAISDDMTFVSPSSGDRVGASFITPKTEQDLQQRHNMMAHWARASFGMPPSCLIRRSEISKAPSGTYPEVRPFAQVIMSGTMSNTASDANM